MLLFVDVEPSDRLKRFECVPTGERAGARLSRVQAHAGERPLAWLAVEPSRDAFIWTTRRARRGLPTLLLPVRGQPAERNVDTVIWWACSQGRPDVIDIGSTAEGLAGALSNFTAHAFTFRGRSVASMEGLLQSLKVRDRARQAAIQRLAGRAAKDAAQPWSEQLFWDGRPLDRHGEPYQELLDEAYAALFAQNAAARAALDATGAARLEHTMGASDPATTVLTAVEFCERLERVRANSP